MRFRILLGIAVGSLLLCAAVIVTSHLAKDSTLWSAPAGERIVGLQSGSQPGHIFAISERSGDGEWVLREIDRRGNTRVIASGHGHPQSTGSLSGLSWDGNKLLIGLIHTRQMPRRTVVECDVRDGSTVPVEGIAGATTFNLCQPYSPRGDYLLLTGAYGKSGGSHGVWMINRRLKRFVRVSRDVRSIHSISWSSRGRAFVYFGSTGRLLGGNPSALATVAWLPTGSIGFVEPAGDRVLVVRRVGSSTEIRCVDMRGQHQRVVYRTTSTAVPITLRYSDWGGTVVDLIGPGSCPVLVAPDGRARTCAAGCGSRLVPGVAIMERNVLVTIDLGQGTKPDRLLKMLVR